jgi:hypothetical protein
MSFELVGQLITIENSYGEIVSGRVYSYDYTNKIVVLSTLFINSLIYV